MKQIFLLTFVSVFILLSCKKSNEEIVSNDKSLLEKFTESPDSIVYAKVISINPMKLSSEKLVEKSALIQGTDIKTYGYVIKTNPSSPSANVVQNPWTETGWFLLGRCWVYGTLITGDNGSSIFIPCGLNCPGYNDLCPDEFDEWMVRRSRDSKEKYLKLKF